MDLEAPPTSESTPALEICTHFGDFDKKKLTSALKNWFKEGLCFKKHEVKGMAKDPLLLINLNKYVVGCSKQAQRKCLYTEYQRDADVCLSLNPTDGMIWCYKCDMSFEEMHQMYNEVHGVEEDPRFKNMASFEDQTLELLNQLRQAEEEQPSPAELLPAHKVPSVVFGIQNIGNTCFFNSTMQALNATRELVNFYVESAKQEYFYPHDDLLRSSPILRRNQKPQPEIRQLPQRRQLGQDRLIDPPRGSPHRPLRHQSEVPLSKPRRRPGALPLLRRRPHRRRAGSPQKEGLADQ
jgi:hypothetical protein